MPEELNDRTITELRAMARLYESRGQATKALELMELAQRIENNLNEEVGADLSRQLTQ